jgi:sulfur carrier protein
VIVQVNGRETELPAGATVSAAVAELGVEAPRRGVAVAVDAEVVPRGEWESRRLAGGERVEVVMAIQGG